MSDEYRRFGRGHIRDGRSDMFVGNASPHLPAYNTASWPKLTISVSTGGKDPHILRNGKGKGHPITGHEGPEGD